MRLLTTLLSCALSACGGSSQTVEEYTRANLVETRAEAVSRHVQPCIDACDKAIAKIDEGARIQDPGWFNRIEAIHAACDVPLGRR